MIVSICFLPQPPIIVGDIAGGAVGELDSLRAACTHALATGAVGAELNLLVGATTGLAVGRWLLAQARLGLPISEAVVESGASTAACQQLGTSLATASIAPTALVVMGDGSACRSETSPGYLDDRAIGFDQSVADALAEADCLSLLELDPTLASELIVAGRAPWQVAAAAAEAMPTTWRGELVASTDPYGVMYFVASWLPASLLTRGSA